MAWLPTDTILYEILPRLPAKALMRFKLVSKSFNKHISSPIFVEDQLRRSTSKGILVFIDQQSRGGVHLVDLDSPKSPPVFCSFPKSVAIVGTCNGLVCFQVDLTLYHEFYLFNPSTGISLHIPPCRLERWGTAPEEYHSLLMIGNFGFGYDYRTDDYKLVGIIDNGLDGDSGVSRDFMVYSLRAKSWKLIQNGLPSSKDYLCTGGGVCIDDHLVHWLYSTVYRITRIACFDLCSERRGEDVTLPDVNLSRTMAIFRLGHFDGLLCFLASRPGHGRVEVWVMKEYRVKESWVNLSEIDHLQLSLGGSVYSSRRDSELEIELHRDDNWGSYGYGRDKEGKLIWYWIEDNKSRPAQIHQLHVIGAHVCKGSLVTIPNGIELGKAKHKKSRV